ncbi:ABC transporter substrate-binding protein [Pelagicoccus albus]|uniref:Thiamine pyrimidine synthase n=1 Tax=Pelagicoccus albus TaxID=415222 RepID=A0A7X1B976_9BACT|nr:ABC transporter substrate-binding protein [Pelagicoccus albus]MBC2607891.1 ABC transporter substrate-binding protein [Pelagicoccus albus]
MRRAENQDRRASSLACVFAFWGLSLAGCGGDSSPEEQTISLEEQAQSKAAALAFEASLEETERLVRERMPASSYVDQTLMPKIEDLSTAPEFDEVVKLRVGAPWVFNDETAPWYIGQELGYFREAGLEIELVEGGPGRNPFTLLLGGQLDIAVSAYFSLVPTVRTSPTGGDVVVINAVLKNTPAGVLAIDHSIPQDQRSDWKLKPEDMRNKVLGVQAGSDRHAAIYLQASGIPEESVEVIRVGNSPEALMSGRVDFMLAWIVNQPRILEANGFKNWAFFLVSDYYYTSPSDVSVVLREMLESRPDVVYRYNWALLKSVRYLLEHSDDAAEITARYIPDAGLDLEQIKWRFDLQRSLIEGTNPEDLLMIDVAELDKVVAYNIQAGTVEMPPEN